MKLAQLHEARYHDRSEWVEWVRSSLDKVGPDPEEGKICIGNERKIPVLELSNVIKDLTRAFGEPNQESPYKDLDYQWCWHIGDYRIVAFSWGSGSTYTGLCVGKKN